MALTDDDYYALLGVEADADPAALRRAWRRLALEWHPDRAGPDATETFRRIGTAYAVLSDPLARAAYDRRRGTVRRPAPAPSVASVAAPGVMLSRLSGPLNALIASGVARRAEDDVIELLLDPRDAAQGGMATIAMRVPVRCPDCDGGGAPCQRCGRRGTVDELFSAWLAVPPGVADGALLAPTTLLRGMVGTVTFRVRVRGEG
jgi:curved DNA-binding protein CbpA